MGVKSAIISPYARYCLLKIEKDQRNALETQERIWKSNINVARDTAFGRDYGLASINTYDQYRQQIPILDYEKIKPYMDRVQSGEKDVLWPGRPSYIVGTAGTTSGVKYIPLSKQSVPYHFGTARNATMAYAYKHGLLHIFDGKLLFLSGSPKLDDSNGIPIGRLSGIVNHQIPQWLRRNQVPSYEVNIIPDWEEKVKAIIKEIYQMDLRMISGIPPWVAMFLEQLLIYTDTSHAVEVFGRLGLYVHGGMNYDPYRSKMNRLIGKEIPSMETYPATEGFIAFQTDQGDDSLLLNTNAGVFFEFVPVDQIYRKEESRISLADVKVGVPYAIMLSNNAGLFCSMIGDIVEFTSIDPYRLLVKGRIQHFISAFGEHVIAQEVEKAITNAIAISGIEIHEFTVAPQVQPPDGSLPYHEWAIEVSRSVDLNQFTNILDMEMQKINFHYRELVQGKVIRPLLIKKVPLGTFAKYQKSLGKIGGQNKVARLSNNRKILESIYSLLH